MFRIKIFIFLLLIILTPLANAQIKYHSPRKVEIHFNFSMVTENVSFDQTSDLKYWCSIPTEDLNQRNIELLSINPEPASIENYTFHDSRFAYWDFSQQPNKKTHTVKIDLAADLYQVVYFLSPENVPDNYETEDPGMIAYYTRNDSLAFISPKIKEIAAELAKNVSHPFLQVRNIYRWIIQHLEPEFPVMQRGTRYLLSHPNNSENNIYSGDSAEYGWVFVALCRALDIPARVVNGFLTKPGWETPHTWVEYYLPKHGWITADPFLGDSEELMIELTHQNDAYYYFLHLDHYHLAFYKGSGFQLKPDYNYASKPFIFDKVLWYAPLGIWNIEKFTNANGSLTVSFEGLHIDKFTYPDLGVQFKISDQWLQRTGLEEGVIQLNEKFFRNDKSAELTLNGRELPVSRKRISAEEAAKLEINSLKKLNRSFKVIEEKPVQIDQLNGYLCIAEVIRDREQQKEHRLYLVEDGHLIWFVLTANTADFERAKDEFEAMIKTLTINIPQRR